MPVAERQERGRADGRRDPGEDEERLPSEAIRGETEGEERQRRDDVADREYDADVGARRAEILEEERRERAEEPEADAPQDLRGDEDAAVAAQSRPFTMPSLRRFSNSLRAALLRSGSASTSMAVSASAFAATSARSSASGVRAWSRNAVE